MLFILPPLQKPAAHNYLSTNLFHISLPHDNSESEKEGLPRAIHMLSAGSDEEIRGIALSCLCVNGNRECK